MEGRAGLATLRVIITLASLPTGHERRGGYYVRKKDSNFIKVRDPETFQEDTTGKDTRVLGAGRVFR